MQDLVIKIIESSAAPNRAWTAELWSGFPGSAAGARVLAPTTPYTQVQLERALPGAGTAMDQAAVLDKIRNEDRPNPIFEQIGVRLYELLEKTGVAAEWRRLRAAAETNAPPDDSLRTYLQLPAFLDEWPWELLARPVDAGLYEYAFLTIRHPTLRVAQVAVTPAPCEDTAMRVLLVSGQEQLDRDHRAYEELRLIRKIFQSAGKSVLVELCEAPEKASVLEESIQFWKPHILHFVGHGSNPAGGRFALQFNRNGLWEWSTADIHKFFTNLRVKPRLVVLNSCHASRREVHAAPATAAILWAGVPAVIGALAALQVDYAREFSENFYSALADGQPLDVAMMMARERLSSMGSFQGIDRRHWGLPVLTVQRPPAEIIRFKRATPVQRNCEVSGAVFERPGRFVDRASDRWSVLSAFQPADRATPGFRGVIIDSLSSKVGKDWFIRRVVRDFHDSGYIVRYAELVGPLSRTSLDVLEEWRGRPNVNSPLLAPPPQSEQHFDAFDQALRAARQETKASHIEDAFREFKAAFQSYRNGRDVLLVLGRFRAPNQPSVPSTDFQQGLLSKLLLPIRNMAAEVAGFHALLIVRRHNEALLNSQASDLDEFALGQLSAILPDEAKRVPADGFKRHPILEFEPADVERHFDEFAEFVHNPGIDALRQYVQLTTPRAWSPLQLREIEGAVLRALQTPGSRR